MSRVWEVAFAAIVLMGCSAGNRRPPFSSGELQVIAGGRPSVALSRPQAGEDRPQILAVEILPGRGMNIFQIRAFLPGRGIVALLDSPPVESAAKLMDGGPGDFNGNQSFQLGGAILLPFANRIRGRLIGERTLRAGILNRQVELPANWKGRNAGAEPHAMHGLMLASRMEEVRTEADENHASVTGTLDAGDFHGHWLSKTVVAVTAELRSDSFSFTVTAKNAGGEPLPMGIGWHPYFALPSGKREQARLRIPARERALVNNYDDVFPTGKLAVVRGTPYDFSGPGGAPLGNLSLDDCFVGLERNAVAEIVDPAARYGLRLIAVSPQIRAFQVYAPADRAVVAVEPQFNLADPYGRVWGQGVDTGMVTLQPGESVEYTVRLELSVP